MIFHRAKARGNPPSCACKGILEGFWKKYLSYRAEPTPTREIDKQTTEEKAGKIVAGLCRFLDQNLAAFKECSCPAARLLKIIYVLPVIQNSNPKEPVSWEEFRPFITLLRKAAKFTDESEIKEENKMMACACQALWDEIIEIRDKRTPEGLLAREAAREISPFFEAVVSYHTAVVTRDLLEKHFTEFSQCSCQTAEHISMIWDLPAIQETSNKPVPDSNQAAELWNEKFQQLQNTIRKGGEDMAESEETPVESPSGGCDCECCKRTAEEDEEVSCPKTCTCGCECCEPEPDPSS